MSRDNLLPGRGRIGTVVAIIAVLALAVTPVPGAAATSGRQQTQTYEARPLTPSGQVVATKAPTSRLAQSSPGLLKRTDARPVRVMIKLDYDATATYDGGVGLPATSPSITGRDLTGRSRIERSYVDYIAAREARFISRLRQRVAGAEILRRYRVVYGGVAAVVPANSVRDIVKLPGVVAVQKDKIRKILTDSSPEFIGATTLYPELGGDTQAGEGVIYGNLDTGVWPEHPSFADEGNLSAPPGPARECNFGDNPLTPANDPFACQNKLIGGAHFTDIYDLILGDDPLAGTARDSDGHGTHTASTSAGNVLDSAPVFGIDRGPIQGIAPGAYVMEYKVCGPQGCFPTDSAAAVGQAILDGVDVINFSIEGGSSPFTDPVELAFLDAYAAGVFVSASAGNSGPGAATTNHLAPWVTTVGASSQTREFATTLTLTAGNGDVATFDGASITEGLNAPAPVVIAGTTPGYSDPLCTTPAPPGQFTGLLVACQRGPGRIAKGFNVLQGGAVGMILYNPTLADGLTDNHWLPTVHLPDGTDFLAFMNSHSGVVGSFPTGEKRDGQGDVMASFSSRGPGGHFIKPDVTAPGMQILAGATPFPGDPAAGAGPPGEMFQAIAGTSMSSPHNAGAALLLRDLHPGWSPAQIKSALMTTATTDVTKEDLTTPADPFDFGAGRIDLSVAGNPGLTFDESAANMVLLGNDPVNAVHLNLPSVNAPVMPGRLVTTRVATNVSDERINYRTETTAPADSLITVEPGFKTDPGESVEFTITIESTATSGQHFGEVRLIPLSGGYPTLHLPVAFVPQQGDVTLTSTCSPDEISVQEISTCEITAHNDTFTDTVADFETTLSTELRVVGATGATVTGKRSVELNDADLPGAVSGIPAVDPGASPAGYIPLDAFGITPVPIGDEEIINFTVPPIEYGDITYTTIGVDSNGYMVMGGATAQDNNCCNIPPGPHPSLPNNMLAPYWTDLDGTGTPGIFAATLTDGVNTWVVVEYRVNFFGTTNTQVFQVWMGINGTEDISYTYDPANLPDPSPYPFLVGAENGLGQGDMESVLPTTDLRVQSSAPAPGGSVSYTVDVVGVRPGDGIVRTEMDVSTVPGTTVVTSEVTVD